MRLLAGAMLAFLAMVGPSWTASAGDRPTTFSLYASYPNLEQVRNGYFLRGANRYAAPNPATTSDRTSLWFEPLADGAFKQFATAPYGECHWDLLRWEPGPRGLLVYISTGAQCYSDHTEISFSPGIAYMPKTWSVGQPWVDRGVSQTVYSDGGVAICTGTNSWVSTVEGLVRMPGGGEAVHTETNESQSLTAVPGSQVSSACPPGQVTSFVWQENYYLATPIDVRALNGALRGTAVGLARSAGGNLAFLQATGHPEWDSVFTKWEPLPPLIVGTVTSSTTSVANGSTGNTISFTYTAPPSGIRNGVLRIVVPPGWTPPVTTNAPGCTESDAGVVATSAQLITVSSLTLAGNGATVISYGANSGGACAPGDGTTASTTPGAPVWRAQVRSAGEPFTSFPQLPAINVEAPLSP